MHQKVRDSFVFTTVQEIPLPRNDVFPFFSRAENLQSITPEWLKFRITSPLPIPMEKGALIDYRLRLYGFPVKWRTEITAWEPPFRFVDEQIRGPYALWRHEHRFEEVEGNTRMTDTVYYDFKGYILKPLVARLFVRPNIEAIFNFRRQRIEHIFGAGSLLNVQGA